MEFKSEEVNSRSLLNYNLKALTISKGQSASQSKFSMTQTQKSVFSSFVASVFANTSGIIAGHPMDTIIVS